MQLLAALLLAAAPQADLAPDPTAASDPFERLGVRFADWPVDHRIRGLVGVAHSLQDLDVLRTAQITRGYPDPSYAVLTDLPLEPARDAALREALGLASPDSIEVTVYATLDEVDLKAQLERHYAFLWLTSREPHADDVRHFTAARGAFDAHFDQGGVAVAVGPGARWFGGHVPGGGSDEVAPGIGLLPDVALEPDPARLGALLALRPRAVGVALEPDTLLTLRRRRCDVNGAGTATFRLAANDRTPHRTQTIAPSKGRWEPAANFLVDLTEWRRDAIDRTLEPFPFLEPLPPLVENGTLLIVGGGGMPDGLMRRFIELAGGEEEARLVYVPCSEENEVHPDQRMVRSWRAMGVKHATFIHTKDRVKANEDEAFLAPLRDATGIWFGGGRQWNFADSYYGTTAHRLMLDVLTRGGVVGGSSAGASVQGRYLARATPIQNFEIMAPGYERGGLGFLTGVAIDQHFSQRNRQKDLASLVDRYPQLLGIGIDERTAIEVQGSRAVVSGKGQVFFYDRRVPVVPGEPDYSAFGAGSVYDLVARRLVE